VLHSAVVDPKAGDLENGDGTLWRVTRGDERLKRGQGADETEFSLPELGCVGDEDVAVGVAQHLALDLGLRKVDVRDPVDGVYAIAADEGEIESQRLEGRRGTRIDERVLQGAQRSARDDDREARGGLLEREGDAEAIGDDDELVQVSALDESLGERERSAAAARSGFSERNPYPG
jgi:hypothetical protein